MEGEALDESTRQTLAFLNEMETDQYDVDSRTQSQTRGLKQTTFGALHRESEAKKFIIKLPSINTVLDCVKFELQQLPVGLEEALLKCQDTKELILESYQRQLDNHLSGNES